MAMTPSEKSAAPISNSNGLGSQPMLGVANTLIGAIQRTVQSGLPVGGSLTGGGGTARPPR